jgi:putative membrane protein
MRPGVLLPSLDAFFNACAAVCLILGYVFIRRRNIPAHRASMLTAFGFSVAFLATYLLHHAQVGSVPFRGTGFSRTLYFVLLIPHVLLAIAVVPLAVTTIRRGLLGRVPEHRKIARKTLPVWLYVSVTGVLVYFMLYHL